MTSPEDLQEQLKLKQQLAQIEEIAKKYLTKGALSRLSNIKTINPEKALKISALIAQLAQTNQIHQPITDEQLKNLLLQLQENKKFTIKR